MITSIFQFTARVFWFRPPGISHWYRSKGHNCASTPEKVLLYKWANLSCWME